MARTGTVAKLCVAAAVAIVAAAMLGSFHAATKASAMPAACKAGSVPAVIGGVHVCLKAGQKCKARNQAVYRRKGFRCIAGRLHKASTKPQPQPPPPPPVPTPVPPPPPAQAGHYKGLTSQNEDFEFDVSTDGLTLSNLTTGQINESCSPGGSLFGGNLHGGGANIGSNGTFKIDATIQGSVGPDPSTIHIVITGQFTPGAASGTLFETTTFTDQGTPFSCTSNPQTWTVTKTG